MLKQKPYLHLLCFIVILAVSGCATVSAGSAIGNVANAALEATELKKPDMPEVPDSMKLPRTVSIALHASEALNLDSSGRPLAVVTKIYKLRQVAAFQHAGYDTFLYPQKEKEVLGTDLIEAKEVTLVPGQRYEISEKVSQEAYYIGIVALFNNPAPMRWRVSFGTADAAKTGIIVGVQACALTMGTGAPSADNMTKIGWLSAVRCP